MLAVKTVFAFHGNSANHIKGNSCELRIYKQPVTSTPSDAPHTTCLSWPLSDHNHFAVNCYHNSHAIQCCGHGLLSSAYYWLSKDSDTKIQLHMNNSLISAELKQQKVWLTFPRISCVISQPPQWLHNIFPNNNIINSAEAAGASGYLILQWPNDTDLRQLPTPDNSLAQYTQRALICVAKQSTTDVNIHFRYFAPQHGNKEDSATGSAMRILADYFTAHEHLCALQVSSEQGLLFSQLERNTVKIGGYCKEA